MFKTRSSLLPVALVALIALASCSSPEQRRKERTELFRKFSTSTAKHMLDRNPNTVQESMTILFRDELSEPVIQKLQNQGLLPETSISILKIQAEQEAAKRTNVVEVTEVKPLGPVEEPVVPVQVTGNVITKTEGKPDQTSPFSMKLSLKLDESTGGYPQVVDATVTTADMKKPEQKPAEPAAKNKSSKRNQR